MSVPSQLVFSDITLVKWDRPWCEYLHHGNWQPLRIRAPFLENEGLNVCRHSSDLEDRDGLLEDVISKPNLTDRMGRRWTVDR